MRGAQQISSYIDDVFFPCTLHELLECAEESYAPDALLDALENLPDRVYASPSSVIAALGTTIAAAV